MSDQVVDFPHELLPGNIAMHRSDRELLTEFGGRVRSLRERCNLTRKQLADKSGMSERYISSIETGKGNVSLVLLFRLAAAFHRSQQSA